MVILSGLISLRIMPFPLASPENPYITLLYHHLREAGIDVLEDQRYWSRRLRSLPGPPPGYVHLHWPGRQYNSRWHPALTPIAAAGFFTRLAALRRAGARVIWTFHNALPHDVAWPIFNRWARARMVAASDLVLVNFAEAAEWLAREYGRRRGVHHVPHGSYRGYYRDDLDRTVARQRLALPEDAFVFLAFGDLREYKNIGLLMDAFTQLNAPVARLVVAGRSKVRAVTDELWQRAARDANIVVHAGHVADEDVQLYFRAADVFVVPRRVFSSGSAVLALDFDLPIIGWPVNHLAEIATGGATIPIVQEGIDGLADAMRRALECDLATARRAASAASERLAWPAIAARFAEILRAHAADECRDS